MLTLTEVLRRHTEAKPAPLGGAPSQPLDPTVLQDELTLVARTTRRFFYLCAAMVLVLFIVSVSMVVIYIGKPKLVASISAGFGVSAAGLIAWMARLARENARTGILLTLVKHVDQATIRTMVTVLLKEVRK